MKLDGTLCEGDANDRMSVDGFEKANVEFDWEVDWKRLEGDAPVESEGPIHELLRIVEAAKRKRDHS